MQKPSKIAPQNQAFAIALLPARNGASLAVTILALAAIYAAIIAPHILYGGSALTSTALLALALIVLSAWDVMTFRLPDIFTLPLILLGIAMAPPDLTAWHTFSALAGGLALLTVALIYRHIRYCDGIGLGDVKLFAAAGAWVGAEGLSSVLLIACSAALLTIAAVRLVNVSVKRTDQIAFGPFLALGLWTIWIYGPPDFIEM